MAKWIKGVLIAIIPALFVSAIAFSSAPSDATQVATTTLQVSNPGGT